MNSVILSASMMCLSAWKDAEKKMEELKNGKVDLLHTDVMDGEFVPNLMLGTESIKSLRAACPIPLDIHLMIERPEEKLGWFDIQPGEYVSIHVESTKHLQRALSIIRGYGARPAVALNPATPLCMIEEVLCDIEAVLLMTVNPGFAGQKLVPQTISKIAKLRYLLDKNELKTVRIEVDGNVSFENAQCMRQAGADMFVCGTSSIFNKEGTITENITKFQTLVSGEKEFI